jgi:hypothetical protein
MVTSVIFASYQPKFEQSMSLVSAIPAAPVSKMNQEMLKKKKKKKLRLRT